MLCDMIKSNSDLYSWVAIGFQFAQKNNPEIVKAYENLFHQIKDNCDMVEIDDVIKLYSNCKKLITTNRHQDFMKYFGVSFLNLVEKIDNKVTEKNEYNIFSDIISNQKGYIENIEKMQWRIK